MASRRRITVLASALAVAASGSAPGQDRAVRLFAQGGGYTAVKDVNTIGAQFKTGFALGGGVGYEVTDNIELRATLTGAQSQLLDNGSGTGVYLNRYYVAADFKAGYAAAGGITPYGIIGVGGVFLHEKGTTGANKTQGFAHLGFGIAYAVGKSGLSIFAQGDGLFYSLSGMTSPAFARFSATQTDVGWSAGASYKLTL